MPMQFSEILVWLKLSPVFAVFIDVTPGPKSFPALFMLLKYSWGKKNYKNIAIYFYDKRSLIKGEMSVCPKCKSEWKVRNQ